MLRSGKSLRYTRVEVAGFRTIGLDFARVRSDQDVESVVTDWVTTLSEDRPDLLAKIAAGLASATGRSLAPELSVVPSDDSLRQS